MEHVAEIVSEEYLTDIVLEGLTDDYDLMKNVLPSANMRYLQRFPSKPERTSGPSAWNIRRSIKNIKDAEVSLIDCLSSCDTCEPNKSPQSNHPKNVKK